MLNFIRSLFSSKGRGYLNVNAQEFEELLEDSNAALLDIRTVQEFESGHIPNAIHADMSDGTLEKIMTELDHDQKVLLYCRSGFRSASAAYFMAGKGFTDVYNLKGGILRWHGPVSLAVEKA